MSEDFSDGEVSKKRKRGVGAPSSPIRDGIGFFIVLLGIAAVIAVYQWASHGFPKFWQ